MRPRAEAVMLKKPGLDPRADVAEPSGETTRTPSGDTDGGSSHIPELILP